MDDMNKKMIEQVIDQVWMQVREQFGNQIWRQVWGQVEEQVGGQVRRQVWDNLTDLNLEVTYEQYEQENDRTSYRSGLDTD